MDAKVLRAAVSAAIRVTVSTSLISCGGATTGGAGPSSESDAGGSASSTPTNTDSRYVASPAPSAAGGKPTTGSTPANTGNAGSKPGTGGADTNPTPDTGGVAAGGGPAAGGSSTGGSTSTSICGEPVEGCMKTIEGLAWDSKTTDADRACCKLVLDELGSQPFDSACHSDLFGRFEVSTGRGACCNPDLWNNPACTPWGPPVPPELPLEALLAWGAAA